MSRRLWLQGSASALAAQNQVAPRLPRKVRLAFIGLYGHMGDVLDPLPQLAEVEMVAVADPDTDAMARFTRPAQRSGMRRYTRYQEMLAREKIDIVGIFNPIYEHAAAIVACAERGLHVVSEKPLAIEMDELARVRDAVRSHRVQITAVLPMRYYPHYMALKQIVDSGAIGEVAQISAQKSYKLTPKPEWFRRRTTSGGTIPWIGIHMVDLMRWASGREFTEAASFQGRVGFPELMEMENTTATVFHLDNGGVATLHMDYYRPSTAPTHGDDRLRLAGTRGVVEYQAGTGLTVITDKDKPRTIETLPPPGSLFIEFLDSIYNGRPSSLTTEDVLRLSVIVLGARDAAERHALVKLS